MSLAACIPDLIAEGAITREQGAAALKMYGERERYHRRAHTSETAAALASEDTARALEFQAAERERQAVLQIAAQKRVIADTAGFDKGSGKDPEAAVVALFVRDERASYPNYEYRYRFHRAEAHAEMAGILERHSRNAVGQLQEKAGLDEIGREAFGEASGSRASAELADAWDRTADLLRQKRNAAGGATGKLERWGFPQRHISTKAAAAGYDQWRVDQLRSIDRLRMIDEATGLPFDDVQLDVALREVFDTIATDGWNKRTAGDGGGLAKLANRRNEERFLIYKNYDAWKEMHDTYGSGESVFDVMMSHIDTMARDVSLMETLGPNPAATVKWLQDGLQKSASGDTNWRGRDRAQTGARRVQTIYDEVTGANAQPESRALAVTFNAVRAMQVATKLGSAPLAATSDTANQITTRLINGLPVVSMFSGYLKGLKLNLRAEQAEMARMGLTGDDAAQALGNSHRFSVEELTGEVAQRMAETSMRLSGLNRITRVGRWTFGMDAISTITNESVRSFDRLDGRFAGMLQRYGIDAAGWDAIRATPLEIERGAPWLKPLSIASRDLRERVMTMILAETDMAVPTPGLRIQSAVNGGLRKGTWMGELGRSAFQFKGFGVSMLITNWQRMMAQSTIPRRLAVAVGYSTLLTVLGAVVTQEQNVAKGMDPAPMDSPKFWFSAFLKGGAFGPFADIVRTGEFSGGKVSDAFLGPAFSDVNQIGAIVLNSNWKDARGEKTNRGREVMRLIDQSTPGSETWYLRAAFDRTVNDWLREQLDPDYRGAQARLKRRAEERGAPYFWEPGETLPGRGPDWENVLGEQ